MKHVLYIAVALLLLPIIQADECSVVIEEQTTADFFTHMDVITEEFTNCSSPLPSPIDSLYGDTTLLATVEGDINRTVSIVTEGGYLIDVSPYIENPDYDLYISEKDFDTILASDNRGETLIELYEEENIEIDAHGAIAEVTLSITKVALFFMSFF